MQRNLLSLVALAVVGLAVPTARGATIYVNTAAVGLNNGTSWTNAFPTLQGALAIAAPGDEVWVAGGTYHPAPRPTAPSQGRDASFALKSNVSIYGGFA